MAEVRIFKDAAAVGERAAAFILQQWTHEIKAKGQFVAGLATGSTPIECYHRVVQSFLAGRLTTEEVQRTLTFNLDEYVAPDPLRPKWRFNAQSYKCFMQQHLFGHLPFSSGSNAIPDTAVDDLNVECAQYEERIQQAGGIDVQLLGIGTNGHIGFAEPGSPASQPGARTQVVELSIQTVKNNAAKFFGGRVEEVPKRAVSMGLGTILEARSVLMLATGIGKATAVAASVLGPTTRFCPASFLQTHVSTVWIIDEEAAAILIESFADSSMWFGGAPKPGRYEAEIEHAVLIDESVCVDGSLHKVAGDGV